MSDPFANALSREAFDALEAEEQAAIHDGNGAPEIVEPSAAAAHRLESVRVETTPAVRPAGEVRSLPFVPLPDFVARIDEQAREPLVGRSERSFLPRGGLGVVGGVGGSTKTTFTLDAVAHFASGTTWHELEVPRALRVAMIDVEGPREPLRQKFERKVEVWQGDPFAHNVFILDGERWGDFSFARQEDRRRLRTTCSELAVDLVVCNPLGRLGMPGGGTPEEVGIFVGWLRECGLWESLAFLLLHHFNRGLHRDVLLRLSGAWDRDADTIIGLAREGERKTKLTWAKFRWAHDGGPADSVELLEWDISTLGFHRVDRVDAAEVGDANRQRVLEAVQEGLRNAAEISTRTGLSSKTVKRHFRDLSNAGLVRLDEGQNRTLFASPRGDDDAEEPDEATAQEGFVWE